MKAIWNNQIIAESHNTIVVEGNHYFPMADIHQTYFKKSDTTSVCGWKGTAEYFHIVVNEKSNQDAAWHYPQPKEAAHNIKNYVAFWKGVDVSE